MVALRYVSSMSERFFVAERLSPGPVSITGPEAHHMAQVLRLKPGSSIVLFNGDGHEYPANIESVQKNLVQVSVLSVDTPQRERIVSLTIACPVPKGDRAQFLIEKLTELGVHRFIPLKTHRSIIHPGEGKLDKLNRYVIEASKQCGRNVLMTIEPMMSWQELAADSALPDLRFIADASGKERISLAKQAMSAIIAIGPEGGWTSDEILLAREYQWILVTLAPAILRLETAALAAAVLALEG